MCSIGDRIKKVRKIKSLTQQELADKLNCGKSTVSMIEVNKRKPSIDLLDKIANILETNTDYLLGRTSIMLMQETYDKLKEAAEKYQTTPKITLTTTGIYPNDIKDILNELIQAVEVKECSFEGKTLAPEIKTIIKHNLINLTETIKVMSDK